MRVSLTMSNDGEMSCQFSGTILHKRTRNKRKPQLECHFCTPNRSCKKDYSWSENYLILQAAVRTDGRKDREKARQTDRKEKTDRQTNGQTNRQSVSQTAGKDRKTETYWQPDTQTDSPRTNGCRERQMGKI